MRRHRGYFQQIHRLLSFWPFSSICPVSKAVFEQKRLLHLEQDFSDLLFAFSRVIFAPLAKCFQVIHETHTRTKAASIRGHMHLPQAIISNTSGQMVLHRATARITKGLLPLHQIQIREKCTRTGMTRIPTRLEVLRTKIHLQHLLCHQIR